MTTYTDDDFLLFGGADVSTSYAPSLMREGEHTCVVTSVATTTTKSGTVFATAGIVSLDEIGAASQIKFFSLPLSPLDEAKYGMKQLTRLAIAANRLPDDAKLPLIPWQRNVDVGGVKAHANFAALLLLRPVRLRLVYTYDKKFKKQDDAGNIIMVDRKPVLLPDAVPDGMDIDGPSGVSLADALTPSQAEAFAAIMTPGGDWGQPLSTLCACVTAAQGRYAEVLRPLLDDAIRRCWPEEYHGWWDAGTSGVPSEDEVPF